MFPVRNSSIYCSCFRFYSSLKSFSKSFWSNKYLLIGIANFIFLCAQKSFFSFFKFERFQAGRRLNSSRVILNTRLNSSSLKYDYKKKQSKHFRWTKIILECFLIWKGEVVLRETSRWVISIPGGHWAPATKRSRGYVTRWLLWLPLLLDETFGEVECTVVCFSTFNGVGLVDGDNETVAVEEDVVSFVDWDDCVSSTGSSSSSSSSWELPSSCFRLLANASAAIFKRLIPITPKIAPFKQSEKKESESRLDNFVVVDGEKFPTNFELFSCLKSAQFFLDR